MPRRWVPQPHIRTFFWDRSNADKIATRALTDDEEFMAWCQQHGCIVAEAWVQCPDDETYIAFTLRWT